MSANNEDDKDLQKAGPLDLARSQMTTVRTVEGKAPLMMSSQTLRGMRVFAQGISSSGSQCIAGSTIITTNIVPQVVKQDPVRTQIASIINTCGQNSLGQSQGSTSITLQRPTQVTFSSNNISQGLQSGTTYHVPRGPAVVANLAAPRGNVPSVRTPMIVTAQSGQAHPFVRPPRAPSPAQGTAWLNTNSSNGSQIKGAPTVLSSPVRGATVTGKPTMMNRTQPSTQGVQTLRPTTILHSAITIGQPGQIHSFKSSQGPPGMQTLNSTVTLSQVLPPRTQSIVYNASSTTQLIPTRLTVASTVQNQRQVLRPTYVSSGKVTVAASQLNSNRLINHQAAARISTLSAQHSQNTIPIGNASTRIVTTQQSVTVNRLPGLSNTAQNTSGNNLSSARFLHSIVAVANSQTRTIQASGAKVITQAAPGTIHLTPLNTPLKTTPSNTQSLTARTINVPAALVQRPTAVVSSQAISLVKAFPPDTPQNPNVSIHASVSSNVSVRATPSPTSVTQTNTLVPATTVAAYTIGGGSVFYDASSTHPVSRSFGQQANNFTPVTQAAQPTRSTVMGTQVHNIVTNQKAMRYSSVMVVDQGRNQPQFNSDLNHDQTLQQSSAASKTTASPRPSILRKRDHEGHSLKVAKNLNNVLSNLPPQHQTSELSLSPPLRPDSRGNGNSSGGSTTISATSSPGLAEEDCILPASENTREENKKPPLEVSPRKKPRKQQLTGNDLSEHNDDMMFISDNAVKKEDSDNSDEPKDGAPEAHRVATIRKPATASILNSYKQNWKSTHNHFMRYSDVKPKEEKKPTIIDLANQFRIHEKINGWKIYHLSTQMDDLAESEQADYENLSEFLVCIEEDRENKSERDINRISELIKGNLQRINIIREGIIEAKSQMMKVFDHKSQVTDLINRCASKRNFKKRDKL